MDRIRHELATLLWVTWMAHWYADNYSTHKVLGKLVKARMEDLDALAEYAIGAEMMIGGLNRPRTPIVTGEGLIPVPAPFYPRTPAAVGEVPTVADVWAATQRTLTAIEAEAAASSRPLRRVADQNILGHLAQRLVDSAYFLRQIR